MSTPRAWICPGLALALGGLACVMDPQTCEELREQVEIDELVAPGLSPELAIEAFEAASDPTLSWHEPAILDDGWGAADRSIQHVGECTTGLDIEVEPRADESTWVEPSQTGGEICGYTPGLLIPVRIRITSADGVLALDMDGDLVAARPEHLSFSLIVDEPPSSLGITLGPADPGAEIELIFAAELVDGRLSGDLRLQTHDCTPGADCTYWAEYVLASFDDR